MRRDKLKIAVEILEICSESTNKTKIVYHTNLNFQVASKYIEMLKREGLLHAENPGPRETYITTDKGRELINYLKGIYDRFDQYALEQS